LIEQGVFLSWGVALLTRNSENAIVERGVKALDNIYRMTARIPHLMKQSHLESSEGGRSVPMICRNYHPVC
jgi:hypothetical protein